MTRPLEDLMEPHHYSTYGYGYGYWSGYGVPSHSEDASNFETTTYKVFPHQHTINESCSDNEPLFTTRAADENQHVNNLLEFSVRLYSESRQLFNKVYAQLRENYLSNKHHGKEEDGSASASARGLSKVFKKVPSRLYKKKLDVMKVGTMRRSLSLGSPRSPPSSATGEDYSEMRLERFKVKTIDLQGVQGKGDQGAAK